mmetsp:Transcript_12635/g.25766  ORF Transcript_12635/g.25766 Transcript_12635/m.25766 type:complete len:1150 (-) Transcript_12635:39-3488(-)
MGSGSSSTKYAKSAKIDPSPPEVEAANANADPNAGPGNPTPTRTPPKTPINGSATKSSKKKKKKHFDSSSSESSESSSSSSSSSDSDSSGSDHRGSKKKRRKKHNKKRRKHKRKHRDTPEMSPPVEIDEEDRQLLELLQEYFGFYGTGDEYSDQIVRETLDKLGPDVLNLPDEYGNTILLLATQYGAFDLVPKLLNKGVDVNIRNKDGACPLHFCCYTDTFAPDSAQLLIENGAAAEVIEKSYGCTPLHWAASAGDTSLCKLLCNAGALPSTMDNHGCDPVAYATQQEGAEECVNFLKSVKKNMSSFNLSAPTPPKGKYVGKQQNIPFPTIEDKNIDNMEAWEKQKDDDGNVYYINGITGESMWADEFGEYSKQQSLVTPAKDPTRRPSLDASVSKETFEQRLKSMQEKMELQLVEQLKSLENKIGSPGGIVSGGQNSFVDDTTVELLRSEVAKKELEILKLNKQIIDLQEKLSKGDGNGSTNASEPEDPDEVQMWVSSSKAAKMEEDLKSKTDKVDELTKQNLELQTAITSVERLLVVTEKKLENEQETVNSLQDQLERERRAKEEAMGLLDGEGGGGGGEISKEVLEAARKADLERIASLEADIKKSTEKASKDMLQLSKRLETKEKMLLEAQSKLSTMRDDLVQSMGAQEEEISDMRKEHEGALAAVKKELQEQQLLRLSQITELNEAKLAADNAAKQQAILLDKIKTNDAKIKEASGLLENNERLHKALAIETERRKTLHNKIEDMKGRIRVYVRIRPLSKNEIGNGSTEACKAESKKTALILPDREKKGDMAKTWDFDSVFSGDVAAGNTQENVFKDTSYLITSAVDGFNVCIFAYGQTGSGKTFTMFGAGGVGGGIGQDGSVDPLTGLAPRAASELFRVLKEREASSEIAVSATMFELYNDAVVDLLAPSDKSIGKKPKLDIKLAEHSKTGFVEVIGSVEEEVANVQGLLDLFKRGAESRTVASTQMNADSSRSHLITSIKTKVTNKRNGNVVSGKLTLVDLAGSERVGKSGATGDQLKEAQSINKSLSALGDVISALTTGSKHVPYRNHPLTMLMSDSIGGNAKTLMFVCCSPADYNRSETGNSLDFAKRCKNVKNYQQGGSAGQAAQLKALKAELDKLKGGGGRERRVPGGPPGMKRPGMR